jgi:hypothetical protein
MRFVAGILLALLLAGCATKAPHKAPYRHAVNDSGIKGIVLCSDIANALPHWEAEARRHGITDCVIVVAHGDEFLGTWMAFPDAPMKPILVEQLLWAVRRQYPNKLIIASICNPGDIKITVPDVFYAREAVWVKPGDRWRILPSGRMDFAVGCLDSFGCTRVKGCNPH